MISFRQNRAVLFRYFVTGTTTAFLYFVCGMVLMQSFHWSPAEAATGSFVAVVLFNYAMHFYFTFRSDEGHLPVLSRFLAMTAGGILLNWWLAETLYPLLQSLLAVQFICAVVVLVWNLVLNWVWVFAKQEKA